MKRRPSGRVLLPHSAEMLCQKPEKEMQYQHRTARQLHTDNGSSEARYFFVFISKFSTTRVGRDRMLVMTRRDATQEQRWQR